MSVETAAKRLKMTGPLIGTHNGHFHADEALAVYLLRLLPTYNSSPLVRTRDPVVLSTCHTVVDVGGEYVPSSNRYDHHQRTFSTTFPSHETKLSSAGLVYMHFGRAIIAHRTGLPESHPDLDLLYNKLYDNFIEAIDANDNGIPAYDPSVAPEKRFSDHGVTIMSLVSDLNTAFSPDDAHPPPAPPDPASVAAEMAGTTPELIQAAEDARFIQASTLMGTTFLRKLHGINSAWLPARSRVQSAYKSRQDVDASGKIMVLPETGIPWKEHLYTLESAEPEDQADAKVLYVLYPENASEGSKWRVQCVSVSRDSFESRRALREDWRGVRDSELSAKTGIPGCVFVHASGFIGGNETKEGALEMARMSMVD